MQSAARRYRYSYILLRQMVLTDFKLRYQGSALGYFWSLLRPLTLFTILYIVFVRFLRVGEGIPFFPIYLLLGIVLWNFFVEVTSQAIVSIVGRGDLLRKLNFPRYVIVLSTAFSALINLLLNLLVVVIFMALNHVPFELGILLVPLLIIELFVFSLAVAFFLSTLYVRFRDITYIWELTLQAAFYATPILYPLQIIPVAYAKILILNPAAQIIQDARYLMITHDTITIDQLYQSSYARLIPIAITIILAVWAAQYFRKQAKYFAEDV